MLRRTAPVLLALALATGCGGGGTADADAAAPSPAASTTGLAKAEFLAQADEICTEALAAIEAVPEPTGPEDLDAALTATVTSFRESQSELVALAADQADRAELERIFLTPLAEQVTALEAFLPEFAESMAAFAESMTALGELAALDPEDLTPEQLAQLEQLGEGGADPFEDVEYPELVEPDFAAMKAYGFTSCLEVGEQEE